MALIVTLAKGGAVAGVAALAEAGVFGSIQGRACGELVTGIADVRERAWIHETGEPCCGDTQRRRFCDASVTKQLSLWAGVDKHTNQSQISCKYIHSEIYNNNRPKNSIGSE